MEAQGNKDSTLIHTCITWNVSKCKCISGICKRCQWFWKNFIKGTGNDWPNLSCGLSNVAGKGVFALGKFCKGEYFYIKPKYIRNKVDNICFLGEPVVEYKGDYCSADEGKIRLEKIAGMCYIYFFETHGVKACIEATLDDGSFGQLINHSKKFNT